MFVLGYRGLLEVRSLFSSERETRVYIADKKRTEAYVTHGRSGSERESVIGKILWLNVPTDLAPGLCHA